MACDTSRRRHPGSVQRWRSGEATDPTRVRIPRSLQACAIAQFAVKRLHRVSLAEQILDHLRRGDVDSVTVDRRYYSGEDEVGFDCSVEYDGKTHRLHIDILPTGGACA